MMHLDRSNREQQRALRRAVPRRQFRGMVALGAVSILSVTTGCTAVPRDTSPQVLRAFEPPQVSLEVPQPRANVSSDIVLRDFYAAAAHPIDDFQAMRAYMTPQLADSWQDGDKAMIADGVNLIPQRSDDPNSRTFTAKGTIIGQLADNGSYEPCTEDFEETVEMALGSDGQWRISSLPDGVIMERKAFLENNVPRSVYFLEPAGNHLVADRRWLYRGLNDGATNLLTKLKNGPAARLAPGVSTVLESNASISVEAGPVSDANGRTVEITGLGEASNDMRLMLAAQIVWTLANADYRGPWILNADGKPLVSNHEGPWTKDSEAVKSLDPGYLPADNAPLRTIDRSGIYEISADGAKPVAKNWAASGNTLMASAAIGVDARGNELLAAVYRSSSTGFGGDSGQGAEQSKLMVGAMESAPTAVLSAESLTRPTWSPDAASVWTVKNGTTVVRLVRPDTASQIQQEEVDSSELSDLLEGNGAADHDPMRISEFRIDSSGTQAAMIIGNQVYIATVERSSAGPWKLANVRHLPTPDSVSPLSLTWSQNQTITVGGYSDETPMWSVFSDGATSSVLPRLNLTPPIAVVTATSTKRYALDTNGISELVSGEGEQQFWRQVRGARGRMAPVSVE